LPGLSSNFFSHTIITLFLLHTLEPTLSKPLFFAMQSIQSIGGNVSDEVKQRLRSSLPLLFGEGLFTSDIGRRLKITEINQDITGIDHGESYDPERKTTTVVLEIMVEKGR
jgi:hypothetical protein